MLNFQKFFKGKKITVMGLGILGRGVGDIAFLAENGAKLTVTDLKNKVELQKSLNKLKKYRGIKYILGRHRLEDFQKADFIFKAAGVPFDSIYIQEARKNKIPIYMSAAFFAKFSGIPMIGVTGTRGKSTVTYMVAHILKNANKKVIIGGNICGVSNLQLLKKVRNKAKGTSLDFWAVFELDSWQLQGFADLKISPKIAIWTTFFPDHMKYYKNSMKKYFFDKANIFKNQKKEDLFIIGKQVFPFLEKYLNRKNLKFKIPSKKLPAGFKINLPGLHNEYNASLAIMAARNLGIKKTDIQKSLTTFQSIPGRLEFLREYKVNSISGIKIYNDNNATSPEATIAALQTLNKKDHFKKTGRKKIILILGGSDKGLETKKLVHTIKKYAKAVVLIPGTGTDKIESDLNKIKNLLIYKDVNYSKTTQNTKNKILKKIIKKALEFADNNDIILFSPAFASFGIFKNEYDRGGQFIKIIKKLK